MLMKEAVAPKGLLDMLCIGNKGGIGRRKTVIGTNKKKTDIGKKKKHNADMKIIGAVLSLFIAGKKVSSCQLLIIALNATDIIATNGRKKGIIPPIVEE